MDTRHSLTIDRMTLEALVARAARADAHSPMEVRALADIEQSLDRHLVAHTTPRPGEEPGLFPVDDA